MSESPFSNAAQVRNALIQMANPEKSVLLERYFKTGVGEYGEGDRFLGLTVPQVRKMTRKCVTLSLPAIAQLLKSPWHEERLLALLTLVLKYDQSEKKKDSVACDKWFRFYVKQVSKKGSRLSINNWDLIDTSAPRIVGKHLFSRPRAERKILWTWAKSDLLWHRRAAVLSTLYFIKQGDYSDTLKLVEVLLDDPEDLMHKACGWMIREVGNRNPVLAKQFLRKHYSNLPRTLLRYAIEKFPKAEYRAFLTGNF